MLSRFFLGMGHTWGMNFQRQAVVEGGGGDPGGFDPNFEYLPDPGFDLVPEGGGGAALGSWTAHPPAAFSALGAGNHIDMGTDFPNGGWIENTVLGNLGAGTYQFTAQDLNESFGGVQISFDIGGSVPGGTVDQDDPGIISGVIVLGSSLGQTSIRIGQIGGDGVALDNVSLKRIA